MPGYETQQMGDATEISDDPGGRAGSVAAGGDSRRPAGVDRTFDRLHLRRARRRLRVRRDVPAEHSKQATLYRTPAKFRVSKNGVEVGGNTIPKDTIHRVIVRNHVRKQPAT